MTGYARVSVQTAKADATCHRPPRTTVDVTTSLFWSSTTGAHFVTGDIREAYLKAGGPTGKLGYPVEDETDLEQFAGRLSRFEKGEILWTADDGSILHY